MPRLQWKHFILLLAIGVLFHRKSLIAQASYAFFFLFGRFGGSCDDDSEPAADEKVDSEAFGTCELTGEMGDDCCENCGASDGTGRSIWNTPLLVV